MQVWPTKATVVTNPFRARLMYIFAQSEFISQIN